jgi:hypothetical protein
MKAYFIFAALLIGFGVFEMASGSLLLQIADGLTRAAGFSTEWLEP